jgi:tetratricopeptide (TPR) repeat protein
MVDKHFELVRRGLELHESRAYAAALPYFERAAAAAPRCPTARYNRANTLHMLGDDPRAEAVLQPVVAATVDELRDGCPECGARGLRQDAIFLMSQILRCRQRPDRRVEAVAMAEGHLRGRRRGLNSVWTARQVRAELAEMRRELVVRPPTRRQAAPRDRIAKRGLHL